MPRFIASTLQSVRRASLLQRRLYHPEPRSFPTSRHAGARAFYRWTVQAFGLPFAVAYLCELIGNVSEGEGPSWKLEIPQIEAGLLTDPRKMKAQVWGQMREC